MGAMRGVFFFLAAAAACFADPGVKRAVYLPARVFTAAFIVLFLVSEVVNLVTA